MRADKWLWHARFVKSRGLAATLVSAGHLRVNSRKVSKPAHAIGPGDVLTFPQGRRIRVVRVLALSSRRGPAVEAQALYDDLTPEISTPAAPAPGADRSGRPTARERRNAARFGPRTLD